MKHLFLPYALSLLLKEKGFNEECLRYYSSGKELREFINGVVSNRTMPHPEITAPLYQQVVDWFRDKHNLELNSASWKEGGVIIYMYSVHKINTQKSIYRMETTFPTYYGALDRAIEDALKLI